MLTLRKILVPIDDSPLSGKVLDHALTLAERFGSHVFVVYVRHETRPATLDAQARDEAEFDLEFESVKDATLERMAKGGHSLPVDHVHADVRTGQPLTCILEAAADHVGQVRRLSRQGIGQERGDPWCERKEQPGTPRERRPAHELKDRDDRGRDARDEPQHPDRGLEREGIAAALPELTVRKPQLRALGMRLEG